MSSPGEEEGGELHLTPSTPQDTPGSQEGSTTPTEEPLESVRTMQPAFSPRADIGPSTPPTVLRTVKPSDQQEEDSPGIGAAVQPSPTHSPQSAPPQATSPEHHPMRIRARTLSTSRDPGAPLPPSGATQPTSQPLTPVKGPGFFPRVRRWFSPDEASGVDPEGQPGSSPLGSDLASAEGMEQAAQATPGSVTAVPPASGADSPPRGGLDEAEAGGQPDAQSYYRDRPDVGEAGNTGNGALAALAEAIAVHASQDSGSEIPGSPWANSVRGQDDFTFDDDGDEYAQRNVRARAFERVFRKVQREGVFENRILFYRARYHARKREPDLDWETLNGLNDQGTRAVRQWMEEHARDIPQEFRDGILEEVDRILWGMRNKIQELIVEEMTYVKDTADGLEELITRPPGRTRSNTSAVPSVASFSLQDRPDEKLDREDLMALSKEALIDSYLKREAMKEEYIEFLQEITGEYEVRIASLEEHTRDLEESKLDMETTVEQRVWEQVSSIVQGAADRDNPSQPTNSRARLDRVTPNVPVSSRRRLRPAAARSGPTPESSAVSEAVSEAASAAPSAAVDSIRQHLLEGLQDISRNLDLEDALLPTYIRRIAEEAGVAIRPGLEEEALSNLTAMLDTESVTTERLHARLRQVTLERDRARRGEMEAQEQLQAQAAPAQQPAAAPTGLLGLVSTALMGARQPDATATATPSATAPPTSSLNHPDLVRLLRVITQLVDELARCSSATCNLAQSMARHGQMNTGQSPVLPALNNLRAVVRRVRVDKPETPADNDLTAGDELWQGSYLHNIEEYMLGIRRQVTGAINTLDDRVNEWGRANTEGSKPGSERYPRSLRTGYTQSQSSANWQVLGRELDNFGQGSEDLMGSASGLVSEQSVAVNLRPLIAGSWLATHPDGPCDTCIPVLRFPPFAAGLRDGNTCGCTCEVGDGVEGRVGGSTRSRTTSRSVSFADVADKKPGDLARRIPRRRPSGLDLSGAKAKTYEPRSRPSTPHPSRSAGDSGSNPPTSEREKYMSHTRPGCGCNCLCQRGGIQVAYYMCRNMAGQPADQDSSQHQTGSPSQAADEKQSSSKRPRSIETWLRDVASDVASMVGWGSPRATRASSGSAAQDPSQVPLPLPSEASSRTPPPDGPSTGSSFYTPTGQSHARTPPGPGQTPSPRRTPTIPGTPQRSEGRVAAAEDIGDPLTGLPRVPEVDPEDNEGMAGDRQLTEGQPGDGQQGDQTVNVEPVDQQHGTAPASEQAPAPASGTPTSSTPLHRDPFLAILALLWDSILFFTVEQLRNILVILRFILYAMWYYIRLALYVMLRFLARQDLIRPDAPMIPRLEILSLLAWVRLVWVWAMAIALNEERRIWGNANPQIAPSYVRGMPYRRLYPWWSLYLVDTDLISPALGGLSESLHGLLL